MLVLFETPAGYAIFKLLDENKLAKSENLYLDFKTVEGANKVVKLKYFHKFEDTTEALAASTAIIEGKLSKSLKKTLKSCCSDLHEQLAVADAKLGNSIKNKLQVPCVSNTAIHELMRCIRSQAESLVTEVNSKDMTAMALGLAHSLSRYKLKFSPDKVDIMVIQAVCLLDELDKQLNNYMMKTREWYGWHFPELSKIIKDNLSYIRTVNTMGQRENSIACDLSDIMDEDMEMQVKEAAQTSMGSEISAEDALHVQFLCVEVIELAQYRNNLATYLGNRMMALSPNLTVLVGELVGARLIAKAGSLTNLAKHPASTLQILGAEKALFRALKANKKTPKYGLIYHANLVGQSSNKNKGKMSRMLAAKAALATRFDALAESTNFDLGTQHRAKLEQRLRFLEAENQKKLGGTAKAKAKFEKYHSKNEYMQYATSADSTLPSTSKKRLLGEETVKQENNDVQPKKKKKKQNVTEQTEGTVEVKEEVKEETKTSKKKKKHSVEDVGESSGMQQAQIAEPEGVSKKKKKKHSVKAEDVGESSGMQQAQIAEPEGVSKKKKKKHSIKAEDVGESSGTQEVQVTEAKDASKKKKKKRTLETREMEDAGEASGVQAQVEVDSNNVPKKKKKKMTQEGEESVKIEDTTLEANISHTELPETSDGQKKKKKKKKEKET
ncbi:hypothetical protein DMN91_006159 [Ooceraea biroi]|uniref:Nucleolar protein n=1 Tax=Ooceraea biroi TaxID=2015173 RepID=A0A026W962_OOCBI|nr:nucleolar protein 58 [Ooceraea biroi]EZA52528.1 Nucleolar protein [Ooceraea biroi]RLU21783.1 hypothetical protein DMN91_006159 [Ooceraea biroi]